MGKATIISHDGDGLYTIRIDYDTRNLAAEKLVAESKVVALTSEIVALPVDDPRRAKLKILRASIQKQIDYIDEYGMIDGLVVQAWCPDLVTDATGEIGTCEIPNEYRRGDFAAGDIQLRPQYATRGTWVPARDGQIFPNIALSPWMSLWNKAIYPAWQKWKPTYRYGIISSIDTSNDTADVALDIPVYSSESDYARQDLNINQVDNLSAVPIEYLSCDSAAFSVGDECLVEFVGQDVENPLIVGFKDHPKSCLWEPWDAPDDRHVWRVYSSTDPSGPFFDEKPWVSTYLSDAEGNSAQVSGSRAKILARGTGGDPSKYIGNCFLLWDSADNVQISVVDNIAEISVSAQCGPNSPTSQGAVEWWIFQQTTQKRALILIVNDTSTPDDYMSWWPVWAPPMVAVNLNGNPSSSVAGTSISGTYQVDLGALGLTGPYLQTDFYIYADENDTFIDMDYIDFK